MITKKILFPLIALLWIGCVTQPQRISPSYTDEDHRYNSAQLRPFGEQHYHAAMEYDAAEGIVRIEFLDRNGSPVAIFKAKKAVAVLQSADGQRREFFFYNPEIAGNFIMDFFSNRVSHSTKPSGVILVKQKWLKNLSSFNLNVRIPIGDTTYEIRYDYPGHKHTYSPESDFIRR